MAGDRLDHSVDADGRIAPEDAEGWASQFPSWSAADPADIDLYVTLHAELWRRRSENWPAPWMPPYLEAIRQWAAYRKGPR
jgi:hypothetical protein